MPLNTIKLELIGFQKIAEEIELKIKIDKSLWFYTYIYVFSFTIIG